jgi:hypothetical protein
VRRATVKAVPDEDDAAKAAHEFARRLIRWSARRHAGDGRLHVPADARVTVAELDDYSGFGDGWAYPDDAGIWTQGRRSDLAVAFDGGEGDAVLALAVGGICVGPDESISVELLVDGERAALRDFRQGRWRSVLPALRGRVSPAVGQVAKTALPDMATDRLRPLSRRLTAPTAVQRRILRLTEIVWRVQLPFRLVAQRNAQLTFVIDEPRTPRAVGWSDDERQLGIHLRSLMLEQAGRPLLSRHRFALSIPS